jgi:hypothetical protein
MRGVAMVEIRMSSGNKVKFMNDPVRDVLSRLNRYRPCAGLRDILSHTKYEQIMVDPAAKRLLDRINRFNIEAFSETSFLEDLQEFVAAYGKGQVRIVEIKRPPECIGDNESYELAVIAGEENVRQLNSHLPN